MIPDLEENQWIWIGPDSGAFAFELRPDGPMPRTVLVTDRFDG
jgi:hypothetical protein